MADVQKSAFALSSATLMMAPAFTTPVFDLTPEDHSVGMAQEINVTVDSSVTELLNGTAQALVDSKRTGVRGAISGNVFEYTAQNFMRAQSMAGNAIQPKRGVLTAAAAAGAVSLSVASDPIPGEPDSAITALGDIPAGSTILIQRDDDTAFVFPTKTSGAATGAGPYTVPIAGDYDIPAGMSFPIGSRVWIVQEVGVANIDADDLFGVKIVGTLSNFDRPVVAVFPKVRVVSGFNLAFTETSYGSMPWQLGPLLLSRTEAQTGRLAEVGTRQPGLVYVGA